MWMRWFKRTDIFIKVSISVLASKYIYIYIYILQLKLINAIRKLLGNVNHYIMPQCHIIAKLFASPSCYENGEMKISASSNYCVWNVSYIL